MFVCIHLCIYTYGWNTATAWGLAWQGNDDGQRSVSIIITIIIIIISRFFSSRKQKQTRVRFFPTCQVRVIDFVSDARLLLPSPSFSFLLLSFSFLLPSPRPDLICQPLIAVSLARSHLPASSASFICQLLIAVGLAGPSTASSRSQWASPDLNPRESEILWVSPGLNRRDRKRCGPSPDLNRRDSERCGPRRPSTGKILCAVGLAGPQPHLNGHKQSHIECQRDCQIECQKICQIECQKIMECQKIWQTECQKICQIDPDRIESLKPHSSSFSYQLKTCYRLSFFRAHWAPTITRDSWSQWPDSEFGSRTPNTKLMVRRRPIFFRYIGGKLSY